MTTEPQCLNCVRLARALEAARLDLENAEVELRVKRAQLTKLRNEVEAEADEDPSAADARAVFVYWRGRVRPLAKTFNGKRRKAVVDQLKAYTVLDLIDAIDGAKATAKYAAQSELEFICRDATIVDRYRCAAAAHAAWQDRALHGLHGRFEVTEELVREGIELLSALRSDGPAEAQRSAA